MADVNALYPQPPAKQDQGLLSSDPTKVLGVVGLLNQNALFQQQFNARKAIGQAYQGAIQPDGSIDTKSLMQGIKDNPDAGFMAGEAAQGALARQGQQIQNATANFALSASQNKLLLDGIGTLADKPKVTDDDLRNFAVTAARNSGVPTGQILSVLQSAPKDQAARKEWLTSLRNIAIGSAGTASRVAGPTVSGAPTTIPQGAANYGPAAIQTAPSAADTVSMTNSANAYSAASESAGKYGQRVNPLRQAIPILENMKDTEIGPTSEKWNDIKSTAVSLGAGKLAGIDPEKIKDYNELKKYFNQYSAQAAATLGPKTNDGLATAVTSNPNVHMDKLSALELSKVALGVERMQQAGVLEFNSLVDRGKADPAQFNKFMVDWGTQQDPRAFVYDLMTKEQQKKLKETLPKAELDKIRNGMNIADRHGLLGDVHSQPNAPIAATNGPRSDAGGGEVLSDADPEPIRAGQQYAQSSPFQMRSIGNGQVQVINIRTGQVVYSGSAAGAANAQASASGQARRVLD